MEKNFYIVTASFTVLIVVNKVNETRNESKLFHRNIS